MHPAARGALRVLGAAAGAAGVSLLTWGLAVLLRMSVEFVLDAYRTATYVGLNAPKALALAAVALVLLLAFPLAVADAVASARFRRAERALRQARPGDAVAPYEGPEGRGLRFEGPEGSVLLLRPPGGFGRPRVVALPDGPPSPPAPAA